MNQDRCHKLGSPGNRLWDLDAGSLLERVLGNNIHQKGGMQEWAEASADLIGSSGVRLTLQIVRINARRPGPYTPSSSSQWMLAAPGREGHLGAKQIFLLMTGLGEGLSCESLVSVLKDFWPAHHTASTTTKHKNILYF